MVRQLVSGVVLPSCMANISATHVGLQGLITVQVLGCVAPAGCPEAAGMECAADVLLTAAARLDGLMLRAEGGLPMVRLAAGLAHGSCFLDYAGKEAMQLTCTTCSSTRGTSMLMSQDVTQ